MVGTGYLSGESYDGVMSDEGVGVANDFAPRKLTRKQARMESHIYWSGKSVAERLAAATDLTRRLYLERGIDIDEREADFTPSRVRRRQS